MATINAVALLPRVTERTREKKRVANILAWWAERKADIISSLSRSSCDDVQRRASVDWPGVFGGITSLDSLVMG